MKAIKQTVVFSLLFVVVDAYAINSWSGKGAPGVFNDPQNWTAGSPAYLDLSISKAKGTTDGVVWDSNLQGPKTGTYTLNADITINRLSFDASGRHPVFNLNGYTMTALSRSSSAAIGFRGTNLATGDSLVLSNGTFRVPESPYVYNGQSYDLGNNFVTLGYDQDGWPNDITLTVVGENTLLKAPGVVMGQGVNPALIVANGATVESKIYFGEPGYTTALGEMKDFIGHTIRLDGGTYRQTEDLGYFGIGRSAGSISNTLVLANGGKILDKSGSEVSVFRIGSVAGGYGHRLVIEGTSVVTMTNRPSIPAAKCPDSGVVVQKGGTLNFDAPIGGKDNMKRFWLGEKDADGSFVLVTGEGSSLCALSGSSTLLGRESSRNWIRVTDKASARFGALTVNAYGKNKYFGDALYVEDGATVTVDANLALGGINESDHIDGEFSCSNRVVVSNGGKLNVGSVLVGQRSYSRDNTLEVSGNGSVVTVAEGMVIGFNGDVDSSGKSLGRCGGRGNGVSVNNGASITLGDTLGTVGPDSWIKIENGTITCKRAVLTNTVNVTVGLRDTMESAIQAEIDITFSDEAVINLTGSLSRDFGGRFCICSVGSGNLTIPDSVCKRLRDTLPAELSLHKTAKSLYVQNRRGLALIVR